MTWRKSIESRCVSFWFHLIKNDLTKDLYGIDSRYAAEAEFDVRYHINEILAGPVLGPHYHSGSAGYDIAAYPLASAVYYPRTVPEDHASKAGYLELGRPNFGTVFEPETLAIRPVAGHIVMFPAFAFHGVVPINQSPRYSINIDLHARRKGSRDNSILGFFD